MVVTWGPLAISAHKLAFPSRFKQSRPAYRTDDDIVATFKLANPITGFFVFNRVTNQLSIHTAERMGFVTPLPTYCQVEFTFSSDMRNGAPTNFPNVCSVKPVVGYKIDLKADDWPRSSGKTIMRSMSKKSKCGQGHSPRPTMLLLMDFEPYHQETIWEHQQKVLGPTLPEMLANFGKAMVGFVSKGMPIVSEEVFKERSHICSSCGSGMRRRRYIGGSAPFVVVSG